MFPYSLPTFRFKNGGIYLSYCTIYFYYMTYGQPPTMSTCLYIIIMEGKKHKEMSTCLPL